MVVMRVFLLFLLSTSGKAAVELSPRFVYVLHGGIDALWGQYMFAIENTGEVAEEAQFKVAIPAETEDWRGQQGLEDTEFKLGDQGGLEFTKTFAPGRNLHMIGFKTTAAAGVGTISLLLPADIAEVSLLIDSSLEVEGSGITYLGLNENQRYKRYLAGDLKQGDTLRIQVRGIHAGRSQFWTAGWIVSLVLLLGCLGLAYGTRPKPSHEVLV